jgi:hypothetical protein
MIALLIFVLTDKKQKMSNMLIIKHHGLYYLIVKIKRGYALHSYTPNIMCGRLC